MKHNFFSDPNFLIFGKNWLEIFNCKIYTSFLIQTAEIIGQSNFNANLAIPLAVIAFLLKNFIDNPSFSLVN